MKVTKTQKAEHRRQILEAAARLFRQHGFEDVSVAAVMDAAGLTHGGFYGHFASKDDLIAKALEHLLEQSRAADVRTFAEYTVAYLSPEHRDARGDGCPFSALGTEVVRANDAARHAMTESMKERIAFLTATAPGSSAEDQRAAAIAAWSTMVGALMLSRISDDAALSNEILEEARAALEAQAAAR